MLRLHNPPRAMTMSRKLLGYLKKTSAGFLTKLYYAPKHSVCLNRKIMPTLHVGIRIIMPEHNVLTKFQDYAKYYAGIIRQGLDTPYFRSGPMTVTTSHEIDDGIRTAHSQIHRNIDKGIRNGSNWYINHITRFYVDVAAYQPMRGESM